MCAVSMVYDHYGKQPTGPMQPFPMQQPFQPFQWPQALPATLPWNQDILDQLKDVIKRIDRIDKALGLPDCHDPKKAEWMKKVEKQVAKGKKKAKV